MKTKPRCAWVPTGDELYTEYHDKEWGRLVTDDRVLFEFLILEGAQAGLSWRTILERRDAYRDAFKDFDPVRVATMTQVDCEKLLLAPEKSGARAPRAQRTIPDASGDVPQKTIIRNRLKIASAITNAKVFIAIQKEFGSFYTYQMQFVGGKPRINQFKSRTDVPVETDESRAFSKDLKKRGMSFVGPTIMCAYMQAVGMVNDHTADCFLYARTQRK